MKNKYLCIFFGLAFSSIVFATDIDLGRFQDPTLTAKFEAAQRSSDYAKMISLIRPAADAGDPEYIFAVGYTMMLCIEDRQQRKVCPYKPKDALRWILRAAELGLPQAIEVLENGHEFGTLSLGKSELLADCYRRALEDKQDVQFCLDQEPSKSGKSGAKKEWPAQNRRR